MYFDQLMKEVIENRITDIHIDPIKDTIILRRHKIKFKTFRGNTTKLYKHLKIKANISLESFTNLQTGSFTYIVDYNLFYLRFAVLENYNRSHGVLRILNIKPIENLDECGIMPKDITSIRQFLQESHGLVLFTGKTGAGKSTTMFAGLNELEEKEIFTLENPIEKYYEQMIQIECKDTQLNHHISQLLRHDPDILVIGEIRSAMELQQAVRAALSGHLIVSTLHAGNIDEVLLRLKDLQLNDFELQYVLQGIVFQDIIQKEGELYFHFEVLKKHEMKKLL